MRYNSYQAGYRFGCRTPRIPILPTGDPNADSWVQMQADTNGIVHAARYTSSGLGSSARAAGEACVVLPPASLWPPGRASLMRRASTMSAPSRVSSERCRHLGTCARSRVRVGPRVGALWARVVRAGRTYCWSPSCMPVSIQQPGRPARRCTRRLQREVLQLTWLVGVGIKAAVCEHVRLTWEEL